VLATGLEGKVCLVTGAAAGIGLAAATLLAGEGAELVLCDIKAEALGKAPEGTHVVADLSKREDVNQLFKTIEDRYGRLDVLIHCAGIYRVTPLPEMTDDEWDLVLDVNLKSSYMLAQLSIPLMAKNRDGRIVLFGSFAARTGGLRAGVHYAATKAGIEGVTRNLAQYAGPMGIRVNCIHPGFTETEMVSILNEEARIEAQQRTPLRRLCSPSEQASMAVVLASDLSSYVHGATLDINGGMYMA
jgi:3-oxoacyl-[acyl-carrier protein] reductase